MKTGEPVRNPDTIEYTGVQTPDAVCPLIAGNNVSNDTYSPQTGLVYFQALDRCGTFTALKGTYSPGGKYTLYKHTQTTNAAKGWVGELQAWNPATGKMVWGLTSNTSDDVPVFSTGGNLVFGGTSQGVFRAVNASTGEVLWTYRTGSGFQNSPISYIGPDGKQYIAVIGSESPNNNPVNDKTPPDDADRYTRPGSTLYVFGLP